MVVWGFIFKMKVPRAKIGKNNSGDCGLFSGPVIGKFIKTIGLKAPGKQSASFWFNKAQLYYFKNKNPKILCFPNFRTSEGASFIDLNIPR